MFRIFALLCCKVYVVKIGLWECIANLLAVSQYQSRLIVKLSWGGELHMNFPNEFFAILNSSFHLMLSYCRYKYIVEDYCGHLQPQLQLGVASEVR
jgi:hypothetical protein